MSAVRLGRWPAGSKEWHAARRSRIGASEIATVCGWTPEAWQTRDGLLAIKRGQVEPDPGNKATARGHHMEAAIRSWLTAEKGLNFNQDARATYVHPDHNWALCNPDDITDDGEVWEYKAPGVRDATHGWGRAGTDKVPLWYQAQCIWQAGILGVEHVRMCVWAGAPDFYPACYRVPFDQHVFDHMITRAANFMAELSATREDIAA